MNNPRQTTAKDQVHLARKSDIEVIKARIVVPDPQLQNKSGRYFFDDTFKLKSGEIFISPLDLN